MTKAQDGGKLLKLLVSVDIPLYNLRQKLRIEAGNKHTKEDKTERIEFI
jgi:hypothetical protein